MKRQIDDNDQPKRFKSTISHFENLPNETIYQIFEYLDAYDIYLAFYTYDQRFQNLILKVGIYLKINGVNSFFVKH